MSRGDGQTYLIKTVNDFLSVPDESLDLCLKEFGAAIRLQRNTTKIMDEFSKELYGRKTMEYRFQKFKWIDDDKGEATLIIEDGSKDKKK